jgi:DNA-binding HxlR family transcriptional regulator
MPDRSQVPINSVARALAVIGDRWTQLILREAFLGAKRFEEYRDRTGAARSTLTKRLRSLEGNGLLRRVPYQTAPLRCEYHLTAMGLDLYPVVVMIWKWETRWGPRPGRLPRALVRRSCGHQAVPILRCAHCQAEVELHECRFEDGPGAGLEAAAAPRLHRRLNSGSRLARGDGEIFEATDLLCDRWSGLVLSSQFFGLHRFDEMQQFLGIASNILTDRLKTLVANGILERRLYQERPPRHEYRLTRKGRDTYPFALALLLWGDRWLAGDAGAPLHVHHEPCGRRLGAVVTCGSCEGLLEPHDVRSVGPGAAASAAGSDARVRS